jgi:shikimate dehydrogenase
MKKLGLIGYPLEHSFSKKYFTRKFKEEGLKNWKYELYPLVEIKKLPELLENEPELIGLNVTIPHKIAVIPLLDELDEEAIKTGAVNTIKILNNSSLNRKYLVGYNTDIFGFEKSLVPLLKENHKNALILGTGGAAKAVKYVLQKLGIEYDFVSRSDVFDFRYEDLNKSVIEEHSLIINTTPLGMHPETDKCPLIPFKYIGENHLLYDLIYNPEESLFLKRGKQQGAITKNGLEMLYLQAEKSWEIWNKNE